MGDGHKSVDLTKLTKLLGWSEATFASKLTAFHNDPSKLKRYSFPEVSKRKLASIAVSSFSISHQKTRTLLYWFLSDIQSETSDAEALNELKRLLVELKNLGLMDPNDVSVSASARIADRVEVSRKQKLSEALCPYAQKNRMIHGGSLILVTGNPIGQTTVFVEQLLHIASIDDVTRAFISEKGIAQGSAVFREQEVFLELFVQFPNGSFETVNCSISLDGKSQETFYCGELRMRCGFPEQRLTSKIAIRRPTEIESSKDWEDALRAKAADPKCLPDEEFYRQITSENELFERYVDLEVGKYFAPTNPHKVRHQYNSVQPALPGFA